LLALSVLVSSCGYVEVQESSGLAASSRAPGRVWTINDSGARDEQVLFLLDGTGRVVSKTRVDVKNRDWEDLASFVLQGTPYLLIADTGDNDELRQEYLLHAVPEPEAGVRQTRVAWTVRFRFPDGSHDIEAMAVDPHNGTVLLIAKEPANPVYQLPLSGTGKKQVTAVRIGALAPLPGPGWSAYIRHPLLAWYARRVTGLDLSPDGTLAAVITYQDVYLWRRNAGEGWGPAFSRPPCRIALDAMRQYEGIAFVEGRLAISQEQADTLRIVDSAHWSDGAREPGCSPARQ
jgi:hypothetical protein